MNIPKQKKQLVVLSVLGLVLLASLYYSFRTSSLGFSPVSVAPIDKSTAVLQGLVVEQNRSKRKKSVSLATADPTIQLEVLSNFDPGTPLNSRNMFAFESPSPATNPKLKGGGARRPGAGPEDTKPSGANSPSTGVQGPPPTPPLLINMKFYGVKINSLNKQRQGFFAEGNETFLAGEGELVGNRYRVLKVGDTAAEIEDVNSKVRRQLPMVTP
jgi:hypothetical protein